MARKPSAIDVLNSGMCLGDEEDLVFYHATPSRNVPSIQREGLKLSAGDSTFNTKDWSQGKVFLVVGWSNASQWQGYVEEMTGLSTAILSVALPKTWLRYLRIDEVAAMEGDPCTFYLTRPIPPAFIEVEDIGWETGAK